MRSNVDRLRDALRARDYRDAEQAFAAWARLGDAGSVVALLPELADVEVRRLGHAIYMALAAGLLDGDDFAKVTRLLGERAGIANLFGDVRAIWQPDVAFEAGRLRQRAEELARLAP